MIKSHLLAVILGFLLDLAAGDPYSTYHPIVLIGKLISFFEELLYPRSSDRVSTGKGEERSDADFDEAENRSLFFRGMILVILVILITGSVIFTILTFVRRIPFSTVHLIVETLLCWSVLAVKSMGKESMRVFTALSKGDLDEARYALSMIVGRDTDILEKDDIIRADVETVAEGTCDAVIAPFFYLFLGGPVLGFIYKAVNTMDSMIGYRNQRYEYFGKCAARLDDIMNYIPSRIGAVLIILCAYIFPETDGQNAFSVWQKDRYSHDSFNAGQTESAAAGALNIRLGGPAFYKGIKKERPFMGKTGHEREPEDLDIKRANRMMYGAAILFVIISVLAAMSLSVLSS